MEITERLIAELKKRVVYFHDATDHLFCPDEDEPAVCKKCGWINPESENGKKIRRAYEEILRDLESGRLKIGEPLVVQVTVFRERPSFFSRLFGKN